MTNPLKPSAWARAIEALEYTQPPHKWMANVQITAKHLKVRQAVVYATVVVRRPDEGHTEVFENCMYSRTDLEKFLTK